MNLKKKIDQEHVIKNMEDTATDAQAVALWIGDQTRPKADVEDYQ